MKIISFIIPSYNMEHYLHRCIDSIIHARNIEQTEILIINDGSKDKTLDIAKEYESRNPNIVRVIDKPNGHYGSCLNVGLKNANGKYFRIVDADDNMDTKELERFIAAVQQSNSDLIITHRLEIVPINKRQNVVNHLLFNTFPYGKELPASKLSFDNLKYHASMHSMTFKTSILRDSGIIFPEGICYTDTLYDAIPLDVIKTFTVLDLFPYIYYVSQDGSSTTTKSVKKNFRDISIVLDDLLSHLQRNIHILPNIRKCEMAFATQALSLFLRSILMHKMLSSKEAETVAQIFAKCQLVGLNDRAFSKYYFKPLIKHPIPSMAKACLFLYHICHPFKKVR